MLYVELSLTAKLGYFDTFKFQLDFKFTNSCKYLTL